ncbi:MULTISPECIES: hypothetical protein [unclassified Microcoleus]|uniref:hypothetical protein n=1 Tax=unclassified Microcoleus TaxID=2642155 RepID=UPI002FD3EB16
MTLRELLNTVDLQEFTNAPSQLTDRPIELQMAIANHPDTPHSLLEILVASSHPDVAQAASGHVNWAGEIAGDWQEALDAAMQTAQLGQNDRLAVELLKFAPVPECFLSEWVPPERIAPGLTNPYLPLKYLVKLLDRLARETTLEPRLQAAESPLAPLSLLEQLAGDLELPVRLAVQSNPNTPPQLIEFAQAQYTAASDWNADVRQLAQLGQSPWARVRLAVAQNPSASAETLMQLAGDCLFKIPLAVAKNPQTPATILAILAEHSESSIRQAAAQHPNASEEIMHQLFPDCWNMLTNRKNLPTSILERFFREAATDKPIWQQQELRYLFLGEANTPAWILAELADVNLEELRAEKLANRQCVPEPDVLETWMQDDTMFLREIAKHPQVSAETLERLSQYPNPWVQLAVAENLLKTPETLKLRLLESRSVNTDERIKVKVAENINTPVCILESMAQDESYHTKLLREIRRVLGANYKKNANSFNTLADQMISDLKYEVLDPANITIDVDRWIEALESSGILEILSRTLNYGSFVYNREIDREIPLWIELLPGLSAEQHKRAIETFFHALDMINSDVRHDSTYRCVGVALAGNPNTPAALREQLKTQLIRPSTKLNSSNNDCDIFLALAYNPEVPETERREYFHQLITSGYGETIAKDSRTPLDILEQLVQLGAIEAIAEDPTVPESLLRRIADLPLPHDRVLRLIAKHRNAPADLLLRFVRQPHDNPTSSNVTMLDLVLKNPNLPLLERYRLLLEQEQHKENAKSREFMSRRPQSFYALGEAIASGDRTALFNAARNPNTPVSILEQIAKYPDEIVRRVLLDNRDLPLNIRLELIRDPSVSVRCAVAHKHYDRPTPVQVLELLANDESPRVRELVAENSDTPLEILVKLANDSNREVKAKVAGNLNTPTAVLERLGLEEGIFNARNPNTPGSVLAKAVSQMSGDELADFLKHPVLNSQMPASTLEQLASSNNNSIRYQVASHRNTPASALEKLAGDSYSPTTRTVASHRNTPPRILEQLAANSDHTTRYNVAQNPNTPPAALEILYNETQTNAPATANSRNQENEIYRIIAANPRTPLAVLEMLAAREFVTEPETEESRDAAMFSGCNIKGVLKALVYNNSLTPQILAILALDPSPKIRSLLERHPNLTPELWQQLAADEDEEVRGAIASSTNCSTSMLQTLASDSDREIRQKVAANRNTTANTLEFLSQDLNSQVREKVAVNPNTAASILEQLARDEQVEVRLAVAQNPNTPTSIRESLQNLIVQPYTRESSPTLRFLGRIYNPDTDDLPTLLSEYAQSANAFVRFVALMHPLTPVSILAQGSQSLSWLERCAVADNPSTSVEILQSLDRDSNRIARAIAQTHLQW